MKLYCILFTVNNAYFATRNNLDGQYIITLCVSKLKINVINMLSFSGTYILTMALLPALKKAEDPRVVG